MNRLAVAAALVVVSLTSLVLDTGSHHVVLALGLPDWIDRLYLAPLLVGLALYLCSGPAASWRLPEREFSRKARVVMILMWCGFAAFAMALVGLVEGRDAVIDVVALMTTHLVAQELVFRGALVQLGMRLWPAAPDAKDPPYGAAILVSGLVFGAAQLQYHDFALTQPALWQAGRALLLGWVMAAMRVYFRSLWPSATLHAVSNFVFVFRG